MAKKQKQEEEAAAGAPEWMVTFSDCMTLLLTFFVLLLSFASFSDSTLPELGMSFQQALPTIGQSKKPDSDSIYKRHEALKPEKVTEGVDIKPPIESINTSSPMSQRKPLDFKNLKVFSVDSEKFFWGNRTSISESGRITLDALAEFLSKKPARVVISENGPDNHDLGLERSLKIVEYMTGKGISEDYFSITSSTMLRNRQGSGRMVEITMLERSIYK